jgi:hypothetical protein
LECQPRGLLPYLLRNRRQRHLHWWRCLDRIEPRADLRLSPRIAFKSSSTRRVRTPADPGSPAYPYQLPSPTPSAPLGTLGNSCPAAVSECPVAVDPAGYAVALAVAPGHTLGLRS